MDHAPEIHHLKPLGSTAFRTIPHLALTELPLGEAASHASENVVLATILGEFSQQSADRINQMIPDPETHQAIIDHFSPYRPYQGLDAPQIGARMLFEVELFGQNKEREEAVIRIDMKNVRERLDGYTPEQRQQVDKYFELHLDEMGSVKLFNKWRKEAGDTDWTEILASGATDEQLLNMLQWHSSRIEELNRNPESKKYIEQLKSNMYERARLLAEQGIVHPTVPQRLADAFSTTKVEFADIFNLQVLGRNAYSKLREKKVVIGEDVTPKTFYHEMYHQVLTSDSRYDGNPADVLIKSIVDETVVDYLAEITDDKGRHELGSFDPVKIVSYPNCKAFTSYLMRNARLVEITATGEPAVVTVDAFVFDYTSPKPRHHIHRSAVDSALKADLAYEADKLKKAGVESHSRIFEEAAGQIVGKLMTRDRRYLENQAARNGTVITTRKD